MVETLTTTGGQACERVSRLFACYVILMDFEEASKLISISKELQDALSTTITIDHNQVLDIVVADLLAKYKSANDRGLDSEAEMLECVLVKYYLTQDELETLLCT